MSVDTHHVTAYNRNVQQLAGYQFKSLIVPLFRQESESGEIAAFDCIGQDADQTNDGAIETDWANVPSYADYINGAGGDFAGYLATRTPHVEVEKTRSLVSPKQIEWGYNFRKKDKIAELADPTGRTLAQGQGKMKTSMDRYALAALTAASVLRGKDVATAAAVNMPATQILTGGTTEEFRVADGQAVAQLFEENYIDLSEEQVFGIISPAMKRTMRAANPEIRSRDFVDSYDIFREFKLPKIDGITYICHPRVTAYKDAANYDRGVFFTMEGMVWNNFDPTESHLERDPSGRYEFQAYMRQFSNAVRIDDKRVVWMEIENTP